MLQFASAELKSKLKKITPFMSTEETRYHLNGVYLIYDGYELTMVGTNGHILAEMKIKPISGESDKFDLILSREAVAHLLKIMPSKDEESVELRVEAKKRIIFSFIGKMTRYDYVTNAIDGTFPDYENLIPKKEEKGNYAINAKYLLTALKALDGTAINVCGDDGVSPQLFTSSTHKDIKCVVMPMRV